MLASKFLVSFAWKASNVRTLTRGSCPAAKVSFDTKDYLANKHSRCLNYQKALEKCPKPKLSERCHRKFFADDIPPTKCSWNNADDYRRAQRAIKARSEKLTKLVEVTSSAILREIQSEIFKIRNEQIYFTRGVLQRVEPKVQELLSLDPVCAMKKKLDVLILNDRTQQELACLDCERQLGFESIEYELKNFHCRLKRRVDSALNLISSCRKSTSPQALVHCVEHSSREAAKILDDVKIDFEQRITSMKKINEVTMEEDKKRVQDTNVIFEKNMTKLIAGMVDCIRARKSN